MGLDPIQHVWSREGHALQARVQPHETIANLTRYLQEEWNNIHQAFLLKAVVHCKEEL